MSGRPRVTCGAGGRALRRVAAELRNWYDRRGEGLPEETPEYADEADRAEDFKALIYQFTDPARGGDISVPCPKVPFRFFARDSFWDQIALSRLRFQGRKRTYVVCKGAQRRSKPDACEIARRVLVLHPPTHAAAGARGGADAGGYDASHAGRQASYNDDANGVYAPGLRVHLQKLAEAGVDENELRRVRRGYELALKYWPEQYHGRHYGGAAEHPDKLQAEHERMLGRHFVEGPLHYTPWVVQSLGGVWHEEKDKWRTIVDATSSGVNPASVPLSCEYDTLDDAIKGMEPGCLMSAFDLTDAFLNWPYEQSHCELMGYADTKNDFFRYRFLGFGGAQSPAVQQRWARVIKDILNRVGLRHCQGAAADYSTFQCVMAYMDDFAMSHTGEAARRPELAREQFDSCMKVLAELGLEDKVTKRSPPATTLEILGFHVDTIAQTVSVTQRRCERLCAEIDALRSDQTADIGRRDLAALVGKLQWVAQIAEGGQLHLRRAYRARDAFVDTKDADRPVRERWGRGVRVWRTDGLRRDLHWWREQLPLLQGRPVYLSNRTVPNGFWRGRLAEDDAFLAATDGVSNEDVEVITTDASGYAGGAWWRRERAAWHFEQELRAPNLSSNYRELLTAVLAIERWGAALRGSRILIRTDNTTTVRVANTGDTPSPELEPLARRLYEAVQRHGVAVAARHIPGLKNGLADALSRRRYEKPDSGDWQFRPDQFELAEDWLRRQLARGFDVDACADPTGSNAQLPHFWSAVDSCLDHDMAGKHVWCNADWELFDRLLPHFKRGAAVDPYGTAGVFVVPEKTRASWWRHTRGFRVLGRYPAGTQLFTRPVGILTGARETVRPAKWPVLLLAWEPARRHAGARPGGVREGTGPGRIGASELLRLQLSGDGAVDSVRLRRL